MLSQDITGSLFELLQLVSISSYRFVLMSIGYIQMWPHCRLISGGLAEQTAGRIGNIYQTCCIMWCVVILCSGFYFTLSSQGYRYDIGWYGCFI